MLRYSLNMLNFGSNVINLPRVVCLTVHVSLPYSNSYVVLIEFECYGVKVSKVINLKIESSWKLICEI